MARSATDKTIRMAEEKLGVTVDYMLLIPQRTIKIRHMMRLLLIGYAIIWMIFIS